MQLGDWKFSSFSDGQFKLDGGSMFGVVPRTMWEKHHPADEKNRIDIALRCLLVEHGDRKILIDTGIGDRWDEKFSKLYAVERSAGQLVGELSAAGITATSITDVILTHLHFDHCGGTFGVNQDPIFPNAKHWIQQRHWKWALSPTERDQASFRQEDFHKLEELGVLELVDGVQEIIPGVICRPVSGHTPGQQVVEFTTGAGNVAFMGDLVPLASQIRVPWIMGYDLNPLLTMEEKKDHLSRAALNNTIMVFEHDPLIEAATIEFVDGKFRLLKQITL